MTASACGADWQAELQKPVGSIRSKAQQPNLALPQQTADRLTHSEIHHADSIADFNTECHVAESISAKGTSAMGSCTEGQQDHQAVSVALVTEHNHVHLLLSPSQHQLSTSHQNRRTPHLASLQTVSTPSQTRDVSDALGLPGTSVPSVSDLAQAMVCVKTSVEVSMDAAHMREDLPANAQASAL